MKYAKGRASSYRSMPQIERPLCATCQSSGVVKLPSGSLLRCPHGCRVGQHSVRRALRQQDELEARMAEVRGGRW